MQALCEITVPKLLPCVTYAEFVVKVKSNRGDSFKGFSKGKPVGLQEMVPINFFLIFK